MSDAAPAGGHRRWERAIGGSGPVGRLAEKAEFERGLAAVRAYAGRHRDTRVPSDHVDGGFPLGVWVAGQRLAWLEDRLVPARRQALEDIPGWSWSPTDPPGNEIRGTAP